MEEMTLSNSPQEYHYHPQEHLQQQQRQQPAPKRIRTAKSCLICRQKKTKCDQTKPVCGTCKKRDKPHLCHYEEPLWNVKIINGHSVVDNVNRASGADVTSGISPFSFSSDVSTSSSVSSLSLPTMPSEKSFKNRTSKEQELIAMNERIKQLENLVQKKDQFQRFPGNHFTPFNSAMPPSRIRHNDDRIDFYKCNFLSPIKTTQGALSWVSLLRKDAYLNSIILCRKQSRIIAKSGAGRFLEKYMLESMDGGFENGKVTCPFGDPKDNLVETVKETLTDVRLIWILVDKFFKSEFFLLLPILDETDFTTRLVELIGPRSEKQINLRLGKKLDLAILGMLLLIMRISSLIPYNFGKKPFRIENASDQYIIDHPIPEKDILSLINKCHKQVLLFKEPDLDVFQFHSLKVYYEFFSPEESDCAMFADSGSIGKLLHYAIQCGLNRDPASDPNVITNNKNPNLLRRLWYKIVYLDSHQLMLIGCPPVIDPKFYDTKFPVLEESADDFEMVVNEWFYHRAKLYEICYPLLMLILDVREKPKISRVQELLKPLIEYTEGLPTLKDIMEKPHDTLIQRSENLKLFTYWADCYSLIYMVYYHFFLYYNEKDEKDESVHYFKQLLRISSTLYETVLFLDVKSAKYDLQECFGCAVLTFPKIELALHRIVQLMFTALARLKALKAFKENVTTETINIVDDIAGIATGCVTFITTKFVKVSDTYYHPWMMSKFHAYIMANMLQIPKGRGESSVDDQSSLEFYKLLNKSRNFDKMFELYTDSDLIGILEEFKEFAKVEAKAKSSINKGEVSPPWNLKMVNDNDKRWFEQLMNDSEAESVGNHMQYPPQFQDASVNARDYPSMKTTEPLYGEIQTKNFNSSALNQNLTSHPNANPNLDTFNDWNYLNELINSGVDTMDFDHIFGGTDSPGPANFA